jgi:hypothetical protein
MSVAEPLEPLERDDEVLLSTAETDECTCPDFCERDHDRD